MQPAAAQATEMIRPDDAELVRRASAGDAEAFDALAADRLPVAFRLASAILGNEAAAAEATQNAMLGAWRQLPQLRDLGWFDAWFQRILINECRMWVRTQTRRNEVDRVEVLDLLEGAFESLDPDDRTLVVLHHLEDRPLDEIAAILHMPVGTVKWRLHEAHTLLYGQLETAR